MGEHVRVGVSLLVVALVAVAAVTGVGGDSQDALPTVDQVVERYIAGLGGRDAIEKLTTRVCTGQVTTDLTSREIPILERHAFEAYTKVPRSFLLVTYTGAGVERIGFDGEIGWLEDKCGVGEHEWAGRDKLAWLLNPQSALQVEEYFPGLAVTGREQVGGRSVYVVESAEHAEAHYALYFDAESGLLLRIGYYWELQDYREVDGIKFPFRISTSRKGGSTTYEFQKVRHNMAIDDSLFAMPKASGR
jgi:hypothetical protein